QEIHVRSRRKYAKRAINLERIGPLIRDAERARGHDLERVASANVLATALDHLRVFGLTLSHRDIPGQSCGIRRHKWLDLRSLPEQLFGPLDFLRDRGGDREILFEVIEDHHR